MTSTYANSDRRALLWIVLIGAAARIAWAVAVPVDPISDSAGYFAFARNLAEHGVFGWRPDQPDAYWPVGAPFLYSLAFRALGTGGLAVVLVNLLFGCAKIPLAWWLVRRWYGVRAANACSIALACWPGQVEFTTVLASELPFDVFVLAALVLWERSEGASWLGAGVLLGVLVAAASYVRPTALPLPLVLAAVAVLRGVPALRAGARAMVALVVMAALIAPWAARNERVFGRRVLISANGGANLWMGNNPDARGGYMALPADVRGLSTAERDAVLGARAIAFMRSEPLRAALLAARKVQITYERETIGVVWNARALSGRYSDQVLLPLKLASTAYWLALLGLGALGALARARATRGRALLTEPAIVLWAYFLALHSVTVAQDRYHFPSVPFIAALAGSAIAQLEARWQRESRRQRAEA